MIEGVRPRQSCSRTLGSTHTLRGNNWLCKSTTVINTEPLSMKNLLQQREIYIPLTRDCKCKTAPVVQRKYLKCDIYIWAQWSDFIYYFILLTDATSFIWIWHKVFLMELKEYHTLGDRFLAAINALFWFHGPVRVQEKLKLCLIMTMKLISSLW